MTARVVTGRSPAGVRCGLRDRRGGIDLGGQTGQDTAQGPGAELPVVSVRAGQHGGVDSGPAGGGGQVEGQVQVPGIARPGSEPGRQIVIVAHGVVQQPSGLVLAQGHARTSEQQLAGRAGHVGGRVAGQVDEVVEQGRVAQGQVLGAGPALGEPDHAPSRRVAAEVQDVLGVAHDVAGHVGLGPAPRSVHALRVAAPGAVVVHEQQHRRLAVVGRGVGVERGEGPTPAGPDRRGAGGAGQHDQHPQLRAGRAEEGRGQVDVVPPVDEVRRGGRDLHGRELPDPGQRDRRRRSSPTWARGRRRRRRRGRPAPARRRSTRGPPGAGRWPAAAGPAGDRARRGRSR